MICLAIRPLLDFGIELFAHVMHQRSRVFVWPRLGGGKDTDSGSKGGEPKELLEKSFWYHPDCVARLELMPVNRRLL